MQNKVYSRYIYQMLMDHSRVAVPEIGTFILQFDEAYFGENYETLHPPKSKLYFSPTVDEDFKFSTLLADDGMAQDDAIWLETLLLQDYFKAVKKQIPFDFGNFGSLFNDSFVPQNEEYFNRYAGLKVIPIKIIKKGVINHDENFKQAFVPPIQQEVKSKPNILLWIGIITAIAVLGFLFWFLTQRDSNNTLESVVISTPDVTPVDVIDTLNTTPDTIAVEPLQNDSVQDVEKVISPEVTPESEPAKPKVNKVVPKKEPPIINEFDAELFEVDNELKKCVMIIGSFSDVKNANSLAERIKDRGYGVFRQDVNGMHRVGIRYNCENNTSSITSKIKKEFNKQAWTLHDTLSK
jgi:cell division septation protein DedD